MDYYKDFVQTSEQLLQIASHWTLSLNIDRLREATWSDGFLSWIVLDQIAQNANK